MKTKYNNIMRFFVCVILSVIVSSVIPAQGSGKTRVWNMPDAEWGNIGGTLMKISRVVLSPEETTVYLTVKSSSGRIKFLNGMYLEVDTTKYPITSVEGLTLGKATDLPRSGQAEFVFRFPALPEDVKSFDFIETTKKGGFNAYRVREHIESLLSSNWRNDATGEWVIGLMPDKAIYDSRLWDYVEADFAKGHFTLTDGKETLRVEAGRQKGDRRSFKITPLDGKAPISFNASRINGMDLGFFPQDQPGVTEFISNGYVPGDSVTISGYLVNIPAGYLEKNPEMTVNVCNLLSKLEIFGTPIDSTGFFSLTFPVVNTQSVDMDPGRLRLTVPVEPGQKYFFFCDFSRTQLLWMGDRSRLLNELMAYDLDRVPIFRSVDPGRELADKLKTFNDAFSITVDSIAALHPSLSPLWSSWQKAQIREKTAFSAGQSRFRTKDRKLSPEVLDYIRTTVVPELKEPLMANDPRMLYSFLTDYFQDVQSRSPFTRQKPISFSSMDGMVSSKHRPVNQGSQGPLDSMMMAYRQATSTGNDSLAAALRARLEKYFEDEAYAGISREYVPDMEEDRAKLKATLRVIDSLNLPESASDIVLAKYFVDLINSRRQCLQPEMEEIAMQKLRLPCTREMVKTYNEKYKHLAAVHGVELGDGQMVSADSLMSCTSGKEIFDRVVRPFRGRLVLIDVWGVWCGPCRQELEKFSDLRKKLDKYGVVYMFFADRSEEQVWRKLIEEYGIEGENVVNYNLPASLQNMLNSYLNVNSFPSYRLVNKDGSLVEVAVDIRNMSTHKIIQRLSE